jgi:Fe/S biogenesis protein NfuA
MNSVAMTIIAMMFGGIMEGTHQLEVVVNKLKKLAKGPAGLVTLTEITDEGYVILQFGGGCNGCSMVDVTLKEGIEKQFLELFPGEIKGVRDATEHQRGDHSFY